MLINRGYARLSGRADGGASSSLGGHRGWGERPFAFVVMRPDTVLDLGRLHDFLAGRVPRWWIPDAVQPIDALPRSGNGKVDKGALRALLDESRAPGLPLRRRELEPLAPRP